MGIEVGMRVEIRNHEGNQIPQSYIGQCGMVVEEKGKGFFNVKLDDGRKLRFKDVNLDQNKLGSVLKIGMQVEVNGVDEIKDKDGKVVNYNGKTGTYLGFDSNKKHYVVKIGKKEIRLKKRT